MALLIETIRNKYMATSKHGRRLFLSSVDGLGGFTGVINPIEDITTTAATSITNFGFTNFVVSGSSQLANVTMQAINQPGIRKVLGSISTSTGNMIITPTNATVITASGSTASAVINLKGAGASIELVAISTALWQQVGASNSLVTFTTST